MQSVIFLECQLVQYQHHVGMHTLHQPKQGPSTEHVPADSAACSLGDDTVGAERNCSVGACWSHRLA